MSMPEYSIDNVMDDFSLFSKCCHIYKLQKENRAVESARLNVHDPAGRARAVTCRLPIRRCLLDWAAVCAAPPTATRRLLRRRLRLRTRLSRRRAVPPRCFPASCAWRRICACISKTWTQRPSSGSDEEGELTKTCHRKTTGAVPSKTPYSPLPQCDPPRSRSPVSTWQTHRRGPPN